MLEVPPYILEELDRIGIIVLVHLTGRISLIIPIEARLERYKRGYIILSGDNQLLRVPDYGRVIFYGKYKAIGKFKHYLNARVESITFHCYSHSLEIVLVRGA